MHIHAVNSLDFFTFMDIDMFLNLYKSIVRPHLEYAVTVCTPLYKKDMIAIENVQRRQDNTRQDKTRFVLSRQDI